MSQRGRHSRSSSEKQGRHSNSNRDKRNRTVKTAIVCKGCRISKVFPEKTKEKTKVKGMKNQHILPLNR